MRKSQTLKGGGGGSSPDDWLWGYEAVDIALYQSSLMADLISQQLTAFDGAGLP